MKIGILTYHWVYNFGANLQTLSTIGYLRKHGHTPIVVNWIPEDSEELYNRTTTPEQIDIFKKFQKEYYPLSSLCRNAKDVAEVIKLECIEMMFLGADTLFMLRKPSINKQTGVVVSPFSDMTFPNPFWGEFLNYVDVPVVGYSIATLQTKPENFQEYADEAGRYLMRFKKLSVRDLPTKYLVQSFTKGKLVPQITPDPVFAFNDNVDLSKYESEILKKFEMPENYILLCMPSPFNNKIQKWSKELNQVVEQNGENLFELPRQTGGQCFDIPQLIYQNITPLEWYVLIKNSKGYIGGLMHPIVSCIHCKVPFYCIDYYGVNYPYRFIGKYFYDVKTSKTYHIVKECGLLKYYHHIFSRFSRIASPKRVYEMLKNYDIQTLSNASEFKRKYYFESIGELFK
jgi:hypothetical protein